MIDDIGLEATRYSRVLDHAMASGRHFGANIAAGSQLFSLSKSIRVNADILCCHRLPAAEYEAVESEVVGTWVNRQQFRELYEYAVSAHGHGFLTIKLLDAAHLLHAQYEALIRHRLKVSSLTVPPPRGRNH